MSTLRLDGRDDRYVAVQYPTLDQYISMTRRNVTPIYSTYASTIVSLLDLHTNPPFTVAAKEQQDVDRLEILEAGTGHGSLTLHLARAIAAGNAPQPASALPKGRQSSKLQALSTSEDTECSTDPEWLDWLQSRRAIVHTVEKVSKNSLDAEKLIRGFRQGIYWPHIDFYAGDVDAWIDEQLALREAHHSGFLSHVILDMPGVEGMVPKAAAAMREDAKLVVFCPSITQIAECQKLIKEENIPLVLEKTMELGEGISSGRIWDVRIVTPRRVQAARDNATSQATEDATLSDVDVGDDSAEANLAAERIPAPIEDTKVVCRPKVGELTFGGGFLGLWRKSTFKKQ